ncbi:MAG: hypothetical protein ACOX3T_00900, partial [Bdellovibrionota bacterium]
MPSGPIATPKQTGKSELLSREERNPNVSSKTLPKDNNVDFKAEKRAEIANRSSSSKQSRDGVNVKNNPQAKTESQTQSQAQSQRQALEKRVANESQISANKAMQVSKEVSTDATFNQLSNREALSNQDIFMLLENALKKKKSKKSSFRGFSRIPDIIKIIQESLEELDEDVQKTQTARGLNDVLNALDSLIASSKGDQIAKLKSGSQTSDDKTAKESKEYEETLNDLKNDIQDLLKLEDENEREEKQAKISLTISLLLNGEKVGLKKINEDLLSKDKEKQKRALETLLEFSFNAAEEERVLLKEARTCEALESLENKGATANYLIKWLTLDTEGQATRFSTRKNIEQRLKSESKGDLSKATIELILEYSLIATNEDRESLLNILSTTYKSLGDQIFNNNDSSTCKFLTKWLNTSEKEAKIMQFKKRSEIINKELEENNVSSENEKKDKEIVSKHETKVEDTLKDTEVQKEEGKRDDKNEKDVYKVNDDRKDEQINDSKIDNANEISEKVETDNRNENDSLAQTLEEHKQDTQTNLDSMVEARDILAKHDISLDNLMSSDKVISEEEYRKLYELILKNKDFASISALSKTSLIDNINNESKYFTFINKVFEEFQGISSPDTNSHIKNIIIEEQKKFLAELGIRFSDPMNALYIEESKINFNLFTDETWELIGSIITDEGTLKFLKQCGTELYKKDFYTIINNISIDEQGKLLYSDEDKAKIDVLCKELEKENKLETNETDFATNRNALRLKILNDIKSGIINEELIKNELIFLSNERSDFFEKEGFNYTDANCTIIRCDAQAKCLLYLLGNDDNKKISFLNLYLTNSYAEFQKRTIEFGVKTGYEEAYALIDEANGVPRRDKRLRTLNDISFQALSALVENNNFFENAFNPAQIQELRNIGGSQINSDYKKLSSLINELRSVPQFENIIREYVSNSDSYSLRQIATIMKRCIDVIPKQKNESKVQCLNKLHDFFLEFGNIDERLRGDIVKYFMAQTREEGRQTGDAPSVYIGKKLGKEPRWKFWKSDGYAGDVATAISVSMTEGNRTLATGYSSAVLIKRDIQAKNYENISTTLRNIQSQVAPQDYFEEKIQSLNEEDRAKYENAVSTITNLSNVSEHTKEQKEKYNSACQAYAEIYNNITTQYRKELLESVQVCFKGMNGGKDIVSCIPKGTAEQMALRNEIGQLLANNIEKANIYYVIRLGLREDDIGQKGNRYGEEFLNALETLVTVNGEISQDKLNSFNEVWEFFFRGKTFKECIEGGKVLALNDYTTYIYPGAGSQIVEEKHSRQDLRDYAISFCDTSPTKISISASRIQYDIKSKNNEDILSTLLEIFGNCKNEEQRKQKLNELQSALKTDDIEKYFKNAGIFGDEKSSLYKQIESIVNEGEINDAVRLRIALYEKWSPERGDVINIIKNTKDIKRLKSDYEEYFEESLEENLNAKLDGITLFNALNGINPPKSKQEKLAYATRLKELESKSFLWFGEDLEDEIRGLELASTDDEFDRRYQVFLQKAEELRASKEASAQAIKGTATTIVVGGATIVCLAVPAIGAPASIAIIGTTSIGTRVVI